MKTTLGRWRDQAAFVRGDSQWRTDRSSSFSFSRFEFVFDKRGEALFFPSFFSCSDAVFTGRGDSLSLLVAGSVSQGGRRFPGKGF
ncbi:hypothetical protein VIGAN_07238600 [Vigna angularis var. angularis]|uniref:Uncharacterized protein n=1 Tax=Vigna angularis var. angularis TaxID=157739 RepID=A0A0S3SKW7_PHAAN|nr:hypothetical protein VIGAN_07238600 [Vigna angularis var. angularis]